MLTLSQVWQPFYIADVDARAIPETTLVDLQLVLDRMPERTWMEMFKKSLAAEIAATPTFLGRYICLQPRRDDVEGVILAAERVLADVNVRVAEGALIVRHGTRSLELL